MARERNRRPRWGANAGPGVNGVAEPSTNGAPDANPAPGANTSAEPTGASPPADTDAADHGPTYFVDDAGGLSVIRQRYDKKAKGWVADAPFRLTNFAARITGNRVEDDGAERRLFLSLEATLRGRTVRIPRLPAGEFTALNWAIGELGGGAIITPGKEVKDSARAAIQTISGDVPTETAFTHLGWRKENGRWVYLSAGSVIGEAGAVGGLAVELPDQLKRFVLPDPPTGGALAEAVRAALQLLDVAPERISAPLFCSAARAPLGHAAHSVHVVGGTGVRKSTAVALPQQFFGASMDYDALPVSWRSTANALEQFQFAAKDALLTVDDLNLMTAGKGGQKADDVFRSQANGTSRERMTRDLQFRQSFPPRGSLLSTGEDLDVIQSALARVLVVQVGPGDISTAALNRLQPLAADGVFASAMSGYLMWLAPRLDAIRAELPGRAREIRDTVQREGDHGRTAGIVAQLILGADVFLRFACEVRAVTEARAGEHFQRISDGLLAEAAEQANVQRDFDPVERFRALLRSVLLSGRAHVASTRGDAPSGARALGWRGGQGQGERIGWLTDEGLFLDRDATYRVLSAATRDTGEQLPTQRALWRAIRDAGLLASTGAAEGRETLDVRRTLDGDRRDVLHLRPDRVFGSALPPEG